jgi:hypothetical protein
MLSYGRRTSQTSTQQEVTTMVTHATKLKMVTETRLARTATYFGLQVKVLEEMNNYSLISYRDREIIVTTEDLSATELES